MAATGDDAGFGSCAVKSRNLDARFGDFRFLIRDRGSNFTASFEAVFEAAGATIVRSAVQAPRMNAICERLVGTLRREILDHVLIVGEAHLRTVLAEYQVYYNTARPHQGIAQRVPGGDPDASQGPAADLDSQPDPPKTCPERPDQQVHPGRLNSKKTQLTTQNPIFERHRIGLRCSRISSTTKSPAPSACPQIRSWS